MEGNKYRTLGVVTTFGDVAGVSRPRTVVLFRRLTDELQTPLTPQVAHDAVLHLLTLPEIDKLTPAETRFLWMVAGYLTAALQ